MDESRGAALAQRLLLGFTTMVDEVLVELEGRGHYGVTATHEFALNAIDRGAHSASALGRSLKVSKQAAAKSIRSLEELGYVERQSDPRDSRRKALIVTDRGREMMDIGARGFDTIRARLSAQVGPEELERFESVLIQLTAATKDVPAFW